MHCVVDGLLHDVGHHKLLLLLELLLLELLQLELLLVGETILLLELLVLPLLLRRVWDSRWRLRYR